MLTAKIYKFMTVKLHFANNTPSFYSTENTHPDQNEADAMYSFILYCIISSNIMQPISSENARYQGNFAILHNCRHYKKV